MTSTPDIPSDIDLDVDAIVKSAFENAFNNGFMQGEVAGYKRGLATSIALLTEATMADQPKGNGLALTTIEELNLTVRTYNVLKREGIWNAEELSKLSLSRMVSMRNFNQRCIDEVAEKLRPLL